MNEKIRISSDSVLDDFDCNFRISAGPGAGKTYWLINHIKHVVAKSKNLSTTRYVACISYTNVAADEIKQRLGEFAERVEVSTIHSFLYKYIVKPYLYLITDTEGKCLVDYSRVDGHDEHRPYMGIVKDWLTLAGAWGTLSSKLSECCDFLKKTKWLRNDEGEWYLGTVNYVSKPQYFPSRKLYQYKPFYWQRGIIDHEDVLYFSYRILEEHPQLQAFISARFPYLFVDEFQDTNPVQTQILTWLAAHGTYVGVIGDLEQAIFSFQGAKSQDFEEFNVSGMRDYIIHDNHRSTNNIIRLLNHVRTDTIDQECLRKIEGEQVRIYVGNMRDVIPAIQNMLPLNEPLHILARTNIEVENIRKASYAEPQDVWSEFEAIDSERSRFIEDITTGIELAHRDMLTQSLARVKRVLRIQHSNGEVRRPFKLIVNNMNFNEIAKRALAVSILTSSLAQYDSLQSKQLLEVYEFFSSLLGTAVSGLSLTRITSGRVKQFAEARKYGDLINSVSLPASEKRRIRTIHQAKSAEFGSVLIACNHLDSNKAEQQIRRLLEPERYSDCEEKRILYVGLSRARDRLFITLPEISAQDVQKANGKGIQVIRVQNAAK
jgi:DNA helicase II / ATP-dependent DNA helicase PcrA